MGISTAAGIRDSDGNPTLLSVNDSNQLVVATATNAVILAQIEEQQTTNTHLVTLIAKVEALVDALS
jgi:hypothetical protein